MLHFVLNLAAAHRRARAVADKPADQKTDSRSPSVSTSSQALHRSFARYSLASRGHFGVPIMRLLDQVAQHSTPFRVSDDARGVGGQAGPVTILPGPADFSQRVAACPLRYVLSDDLVAICTEVALAGGDQLSACLDLIHLPGRDLWIEWSDAARDRALAQLASNGAGPYAEVGRGASRAGALVSASPCGRRGLLRTFWSDNDGVVTLAPMETHLDLDRGWPAPPFHASVFAGGLAEVGASDDPDAADLFDCMRFRFDEGWSAYYRRHQLSAEQEQRILRSSLGAVARDMPMILAFSLLLGARSALATHPVERSRLNHHRRAKDKPPLLDHVHVTCPLITQAPSSDAKPSSAIRRAARLHHVRGHLVRRGQRVFWRTAHVRGRASFGRVRSRTVTLSFEARSH